MTFTALLCSPEAVRQAFAPAPGWAWWWRLILALHGKPSAPSATPDERRAVLARGFRFYGQLYAGLGLLLLGGALLPAALGVECSMYWPGLATLSGLYLLAAARLAWHGAGLYERQQAQATVLLVSFFVAVMLFLCGFAGALSAAAHEQRLLADAANLAGFALFWSVGVGSYGLEVVYLLLVPNADSTSTSPPSGN